MSDELLNRAKDYIDKLANGINPLTGETLPETDIVNNIKVSRCLFYVSQVLSNIQKRPIKKIPFSIAREKLDNIELTGESLSISEFVQKINALNNQENMKKLAASDVTNWLMSLDLLTYKEIEGRRQKVPTEKGREMGIFTESRTGLYRHYEAVLYKKKMQEFILDNFECLLEFKKNK